MEDERKTRESKSAKAGLTFPVSRFQRNLRKGNYAERIGTAGSVYLTGVVEYLTAEILEIAGTVANDHDRARIVPRHILLAVKTDAELNDLLKGTFFAQSGVVPDINPFLHSKSKKQKASQKTSAETSSENFE